MYLYRKKDNFRNVVNLFLHYSLSFYFLYISNFYVYRVLYGSNIIFNEAVLFALPVIMIFLLIIVDLYFKFRKD